MRRKTRKRKPAGLKTKLGLPDLEQAKAAVLASLRSRESQRSYQHSIDEFVAWYCSAPQLSFNKTVVTRYRIHLEDRQLDFHSSFFSNSLKIRIVQLFDHAKHIILRSRTKFTVTSEPSRMVAGWPPGLFRVRRGGRAGSIGDLFVYEEDDRGQPLLIRA